MAPCPPQRPSGPPRLVCRCIGVASTRIVEAWDRDSARDVGDVQRLLRAGTGCGTCRPEIEEILAELRGEPIARMTRMENAMVCREETRRRIEASLFSGIVPKLPAGTEVELISVSGLRVDLHVAPDEGPLRAQIAQKLAKLVCADLEISFS